MGTKTGKAAAALGVALTVATGSVALNQATANAEPEVHHVVYTLTTAGQYDFQLQYLTAQPPSKEAFNADAYAFLKRESVNVGPGAPWVFETTFADPQWAFFSVSSTTKGGQAPPNAHCEIAVDGQLVVQQDHPYSPRCQLGRW